MATGTRKTYEEIEQLFQSKGLTLITKEFKTTMTKMDYICELGHTGTVTPHVLKKTTGCKVCSREKLNEKIRLSYEYVENEFAKKGYKLLSTEYKNSTQKLLYMCDNGHIEEMQYSSFQSGNRCPSCAGTKKHSYEKVEREFKNAGYILTSKTYENAATDLEFVCNNGHESKMCYSSFRKGSRCRFCAFNAKPTFDEVKLAFEKRGYILLSKDYKNHKGLLKFECPKGHIGQIAYNSFKRGSECFSCSHRGENSSSWKGGVTPLASFLRDSLGEWRRKSLLVAGNKCDITGEIGELDVHHKYPFHKIYTTMLNDLGMDVRESMSLYTQKEKDLMKTEIQKRHMGLLGVPLSKKVHSFYHSLFGNDNTIEQYEFFKSNYSLLESGETSTEEFLIAYDKHMEESI